MSSARGAAAAASPERDRTSTTFQRLVALYGRDSWMRTRSTACAARWLPASRSPSRPPASQPPCARSSSPSSRRSSSQRRPSSPSRPPYEWRPASSSSSQPLRSRLLSALGLDREQARHIAARDGQRPIVLLLARRQLEAKIEHLVLRALELCRELVVRQPPHVLQLHCSHSPVRGTSP